MKIYIQDHSWAGMIVVVAQNELEARKLMQNCPNYLGQVEVVEHEIKEGLIIYNMGDM